MNREEAIESFKYSNEQAKVRLEVEKMRMDMDEVKELEFYIERDEMAIKALEQEPCEMTAEEYRQRMIQAFHNADTDELIAICVLPTEKEFKHLEWLLKNHYKKEPCGDAIDRSKAIMIASGYCHPANVAKELAKLPPVNPQPCEDAISRQAVLDILKREGRKWGNNYRDWVDAIEEIKNLSSVNPTKTGHWIWCFGSHKCSNCEEYTCFSYKELLRYCPNCGAKMLEPQERSDKE